MPATPAPDRPKRRSRPFWGAKRHITYSHGCMYSRSRSGPTGKDGTRWAVAFTSGCAAPTAQLPCTLCRAGASTQNLGFEQKNCHGAGSGGTVEDRDRRGGPGRERSDRPGPGGPAFPTDASMAPEHNRFTTITTSPLLTTRTRGPSTTRRRCGVRALATVRWCRSEPSVTGRGAFRALGPGRKADSGMRRWRIHQPVGGATNASVAPPSSRERPTTGGGRPGGGSKVAVDVAFSGG